MKTKADLPHLGKTRKINIIGHANGVLAKIDTGADSSSIWATNVRIDPQGVLHFSLFGPGSEYYTGETIDRAAFKVAIVRSSSGHEQVRYRTELTIRLGGKKMRVLFNLSDRSNNKYPILIGRRTLAGKFLVDVTRGYKIDKVFNTRALNRELEHNPYEFFKKYHGNTAGSEIDI
jgi:hypothetical protein